MTSYFIIQTFIVLLITERVFGASCQMKFSPIPFGSGKTEWNYNNIGQWNNLNNSICDSGSSQSPINIITQSVINSYINATHEKYLSSINVTIAKKPQFLEADGEFSNLYANDPSGIYALYRSNNIHLHTPSEHWLDGKQFPMELHFVHFADDSSDCEQLTNLITVYSVFAEIDENSFLDFLEEVEIGENGQKINNFNLYKQLLGQLPTQLNGYQYSGSLTTPPCSEGVQFIVLSQPIKISSKQIRYLRTFLDDIRFFPQASNNRPLQNQNGRNIQNINFQFDSVDEFPVNMKQPVAEFVQSPANIVSSANVQLPVNIQQLAYVPANVQPQANVQSPSNFQQQGGY